MGGPGSRGRVEREKGQKQGWTRNCKSLLVIHFFPLGPSPLKVPELPNTVPLAVHPMYKCEPMRDTSHAIPQKSVSLAQAEACSLGAQSSVRSGLP